MKEAQIQSNTLTREIEKGQASFLIQFGGQGAGYLGELKQVYQQYSPELGEFFNCLFETLNKEYSDARQLNPEWFSLGYDLKSWLEGSIRTNEPALAQGVYSGPLILATQVAHYLRFLNSGIDQNSLLQNTVAAVGHSQGIHGALLVAQGLEGTDFLKAFSDLIRLLFWQGYRTREAFAPVKLGHDLLSGWQGPRPTPMASIRCESPERLDTVLDDFQKLNGIEIPLEVGLRNGADSFIISGHTASMARFASYLSRKHEDLANALDFLNVSGPYHSSFMQKAVDRLADDVGRIGLHLKGQNLKIPVLDPLNGRNLQEVGDLEQYVVEASTIRKVDWHRLMQKAAGLGASYCLSFGPGESIRAISRPYLEPVGAIQPGLHKKSGIDKLINGSFRRTRPWKDYAPVQGKLPDGSCIALNAYSRFTGRPPIFGGGMTPTTAEIDIVLSAACEGRIVEWAGGGQVTEAIFRQRIQRQANQLPSGQGIIVNLLYLDAYLWNLQYPLVRKLKQEGYPIDGVTISAGIPDKKEALEILDGLESVGICINSFKPGTHKQIAQVLEIAAEKPERKLIMQVEGGAAGGHHSWENLEELIERNYSRIRSRENVILTVGGGIHSPEQANQWLQGTWSETCMPVDGVFLGTRLMAAREAATSNTVKEALVNLSGSDWSDVRKNQKGSDVVSGRSGLGADIYYASNHWSATSSYLEKLLSDAGGEKANQIIAENRLRIIESLNATVKPYFGDVEEMTYEQMLRRFLELTAPGDRLKAPEGLWPDEPFIDVSFRDRFHNLLERVQSRFAETEEESVLQRDSNSPADFIESLRSDHPGISDLPVLPEDVQYFYEVCRKPGKPVNFIPYLDESLLKWYRSDSLWYSHCEGVDPDQCAWIPGPVAVAGIQKANEPVVEILKSFEQAVFASSKPSDEVLHLSESETAHAAIADGLDKLSELCLQSRGILCTLLKARFVVRGHKKILSTIPQAFALEEGMSLGWDLGKDGSLVALTAYRTGVRGKKHVMAELSLEGDSILFRRFPLSGGPAFLRQFQDSGLPWARFLELSSPVKTSQDFYQSLWDLQEASPGGQEYSFILDDRQLESFRAAVDGQSSALSSFAIVAGWKPMLRSLFEPEAAGDVMQLVHLFQEFKWGKGYFQWKTGERVQARARIERILWNASGKEVQIRGELRNQTQDVILSFVSGFLIRGEAPTENTEIYRPETLEFLPPDDASVSFLRGLDFLKCGTIGPGWRVSIHPEKAIIKRRVDGTSHWIVQGKLNQQGLPVGRVNLDWKGKNSPLEKLLNLFPVSSEEVTLEKPVLIYSEKDESPSSMNDYANASGDLNPIHLDSHMALEAGFSSPIVHGMWTSARILDSLVRNVAAGDASRVTSLKSQFQAPLHPGQEFFIRTYHVSNSRGRKNLRVEAITESGVQVYLGQATIEQVPTAYVFTGQGSQSQGMGMAFYDRYASARQVWDQAEVVTTEELGFSILDIVRNNPEEVRIGHEKFRHPKGVLNLTQFTQVGLVAKAMADWAILRENGLLSRDACFAGHSLGEYAALASQGILPLESVIRIVYHRGLTMQSLVERDEHGNSPYRMTVVLGNKKAGLSEMRIEELVAETRAKVDKPLEIVNFNIRDRQYSVTGHIDAIEALEADLRKVSGGHKTFVRIPGIDVPFHSSILLPGVSAFREVLQQNLNSVNGLETLDGRYIPNLVAQPFTLTDEFLRAVQSKTGSSAIREIQDSSIPLAEARKLLLIELLAYQFAQPVLWIQTQDYLFQEKGIRRVIDIGARGDLAGMARQTLKQMDLPHAVEVLHVEEDEARVFQRMEDAFDLYEDHRSKESAESAIARSESELDEAKAPVESETKMEISQSDKPESKVSRPSASVGQEEPDAKDLSEKGTKQIQSESADPGKLMDAKEGLFALLAWKAELRAEQIQESETIDEIFGGNSSKRNQVLADLASEFNTSELEGVQEKRLSDVIDLLRRKVSYGGPGPYLRAAFENFLKEFMPPGRNRPEVLEFLRSKSAPEGLIILATVRFPLMARSGPSIRDGNLGSLPVDKRFSSKDQADQWLEKALHSLAQEKGIQIQSDDSRTGAVAVDSAALAELEARYFGLEGSFARLIRATSQQLLGQDPFEPLIVQDRTTLANASVTSDKEHGKQYKSILESRFDSRKVVHFDNPLPWIRKNLYCEFWELMTGNRPHFSESLKRQSRSCADSLESLLGYMERKAHHRNPDVEIRVQELKEDLQIASSGYYSIHGRIQCETEISRDGSLNLRSIEEPGNVIPELFDSGHASFRRSNDEGQSFQDYDCSVEEFLKQLPSSSNPMNLSGRCILVTGAGPGSIALDIVRNLLSSGATVILGTSTYSDDRLEFYKDVYQISASKDSSLIVIPFSQGSLSDIRDLVEYCFDQDWIPDTILPFGAIGEEGDLASVGPDSLAGIRVMLLGVQSLLAEVVEQYRKRFLKGPFQFILPLSPNHGAFGKDGLYAESKLALEVMLRKWYSEYEQWGRYCSLKAVRIGWVRSTGLMALNDVVAPEMEKVHGIRTFHSQEMAELITSIMGFNAWSDPSPLMADLTGGLTNLTGLREKVQSIREELLRKSTRARALYALELNIEEKQSVRTVKPLELYSSSIALGPVEQTEIKSNLSLEDIVCVVGFGEVSPGGSTRTRWELEQGGDLSLEASVELAWTMGLIEYKNTGEGYFWVDTESGEIVNAAEVSRKYGDRFRSGTGIRLVNPEVTGFDPGHQPVYSEIVLEEDFYIPVADEGEGREFQDALPEDTDVYHDSQKDRWFIRRKAGTTIRVLKSVGLDRFVAGQIPDGWDPERYGLSRELIRQVDRVTLFNLISTAEAFLQAGMEPSELFEYIHPSDAGSTVGGGLGGTSRLNSVFTDHLLNRTRQNDALQETLINVTVAYAVTAYLGSTGPIQTPVAACATGGVSLDMAMNLFQSGKAKFLMAGGFDEISAQGMIGFGDMEATAKTNEMLDRGIEPARMSRPNDSRRGGFVESHGGGLLLLARGDLAFEMGLPVYGMVGMSATHSDGLHMSIPAPGQGLLSIARESVAGPEAKAAHSSVSDIKTGNEVSGPAASDTCQSRSPLGEALANFGLGADDIGVIYKHDTSTKANDVNENRLHETIQKQLGRHPGNPLPVVSQKSYTGHSKAGAASWQMIGLLQCMHSGIIPGNRSLQNVDRAMNEFSHLLFTDETIHLGEGRIKAGLFSTLGFGHVGAMGLLISGVLFESFLTQEEKKLYRSKLQKRSRSIVRRLHEMRTGLQNPLFVRRVPEPRELSEEAEMLLNSDSRWNATEGRFETREVAK
ncbi:MAG: DUF1729 domain-containing protein [Leptospiraceae bacterium]